MWTLRKNRGWSRGTGPTQGARRSNLVHTITDQEDVGKGMSVSVYIWRGQMRYQVLLYQLVTTWCGWYGCSRMVRVYRVMRVGRSGTETARPGLSGGGRLSRGPPGGGPFSPALGANQVPRGSLAACAYSLTRRVLRTKKESVCVCMCESALRASV